MSLDGQVEEGVEAGRDGEGEGGGRVAMQAYAAAPHKPLRSDPCVQPWFHVDPLFDCRHTVLLWNRDCLDHGLEWIQPSEALPRMSTATVFKVSLGVEGVYAYSTIHALIGRCVRLSNDSGLIVGVAVLPGACCGWVLCKTWTIGCTKYAMNALHRS